MIADSVEFLARPGPARARRHGALLRRLQGQPGVLPAGARSGGRQGRQPRRALRHQRRVAAARGRRHRRRRAPPRRPATSRSASTATTTPAAPSPTRWPPCSPAPATCRARSTASASAPATPTCRRSSPTCSSSWATTCLPEGRIEQLTAVSHHVAELLNRAVNPQAPYVGSSAFAHKAGLHTQRHRPGQGRLRARRPGAGRQRHAVRRQRDGRTGDDHDEGGRARPGDGRAGGHHRHRRPQAPRARGLPLRGRRRLARAADAPGRRLGAGLLPRREHAGDHRRAAQRRLLDGGDGEGVGRRRPPGVHRRGQRSRSTPSTRRCAAPSTAPIPSSTGCT